MFKELKRKIAISIIISLLFVFILIIGIIYTTTYKAVYTNNQNLIQEFIDKNIENHEFKPIKDRGMFDKSGLDNMTVFYGVIFNNDDDDSVYQIINDVKPLMNDKALIDMTRDIMKEGKTTGFTKNFIYRVVKKDDITCVILMKNTVMSDSITAVFENIVIFGGIILVILFVFSFKIADKIVTPLEENYKKQKQFVSDAGHELKTPISTISANSEILERQVGKNQWIENIKFEGKRMQRLVEQLLNLAKTESMLPVMESINLSRIILGGVLPFESVAFEKGYTIKTDIEEEVYIWGDKGQLGQLISILTDNALSHAEGKGFISITCKVRKKMVVLSVSNPGKEIPEEEREKIFERFYRTDKSRCLNGHYGLGLSIAKEIVKVHKGKIYVKCEASITSFIIKIPIK